MIRIRIAVRLAQIAFVVAGACFLAWLSFRTAAVRTLPSTSALLVSLGAAAPERVLETSLVRVQASRGVLDDRDYAAIVRAAQARPLDERAFFLVALRALAQKDHDRGLALLEEARRRNPRFRLARVLLLDQWLKMGDVRKAAVEMTVLYRLLPGARGVLISELARLGMNVATSATTRRALNGDQALLNTTLGVMTRQGISPAELLRFAGGSAPAGMEAGGWRRVLIDSLIARGNYADARLIWSNAAHVTPREQAEPIFDAALTGHPAPPPFNWILTGSEVGVTTIGNGAMSIEFYGRFSGDLARQLLVLKPGSYQLRVTLEGLDSGYGSGISWTLDCAGSGDTSLLTTPPMAIKPSARALLAPFVVPNTACSAQWLRLKGAAGEFAGAVSARVHSISIERRE